MVIRQVEMDGWAVVLEQSRRILGWMRRRALLWTLVLLLWLPLAACGGAQPPSDAVIEQALRQQFEQVQQDLRSQLAAPKDPPKDTSNELHLSRIQVNHSRRSRLGDQTVYQVDGTYRLSGRSLSRTRPPRSPFKISLQQAEDGSWRLISPDEIAPHR